MAQEIKKGQKVYYVRDVWTPIEEGIVEDPTLRKDVIGAATAHPVTISLIAKVKWTRRLYKNREATSYGCSSAILSGCFSTPEEAFEAWDSKVENYKKELKEEIASLETLLKFPLKHMLCGEDYDYYAREIYEKAVEEWLENA